MEIRSVLEKYNLQLSNVLIWALIPFAKDGSYGDSYYDPEVTIKELKDTFAIMRLDWRWQAIQVNNMDEIIDKIASESGDKFPLVLNYCDGNETDGFPGISVIKLLEQKNIAYTGSDELFYSISSSKIEMKELFIKNKVPTAPYRVIKDPDKDTALMCEEIGIPVILKPSASAGSFGLSLASVVDNNEAARLRFYDLKKEAEVDNTQLAEVFAEKFISGPEYTVFLVGSYAFPESKKVYPPLERMINQNLPVTERFLSYERYWELETDPDPLPKGETLVINTILDPVDYQWLQDLAWDAHAAVKGMGYSRVDVRVDESSGKPFVLEVNANCGLSSPEDATSVGYILLKSGNTFAGLLTEIFEDALHRYFTKNESIA